MVLARTVPLIPPAVAQPKPHLDGPKVHFFLVADTDDPQVGKEIRLAKDRMQELFLLLPKEHRGELFTVPAERLSKSTVLRSLREFAKSEVKPSDTLLVFCNTHADLAPEEPETARPVPADGLESQRLFMWAADRNKARKKDFPDGANIDDERILSRKSLADVLQNEVVCRLKLLFTDAVGKKVQRFGDRDFFPVALKTGITPGGGVGPAFDVDNPGEAPLAPLRPNDTRTTQWVLTDLFLNHRGFLNVTSASKNEVAVVEVFSESFRELLLGYPNYTFDLDWGRFLVALKDRMPRRLRHQLNGAEFGPTRELLTKAKQVDGKMQLTQTLHVFDAKDPATGQPRPMVPEFVRWFRWQDDKQGIKIF
jgi:hypothetical protein